MECISHCAPPAWVTYVSDEAAGLLLLQELAYAGPGFALQVAEVGGGALVHVVHVLLLQLGGFRVHPGETGPPLSGEGGGRFPKAGNLQLPEAVLILHLTREKPFYHLPTGVQRLENA